MGLWFGSAISSPAYGHDLGPEAQAEVPSMQDGRIS